MNLGKKQGWDNMPYQIIYLTTGEAIGYLYNGIEFEAGKEKEIIE